ncbi:hypothetical protein JHK87_023782 [Glycine soja]|nr:hypothetical protein JHK87_023782 [Glycine soja]
MPFPWKKNRVPRISQFVADLQSPKRGGSLVVETGFPTSLIDLFVKNQSRFQKHRSKKPPPPKSLSATDPPPPPPPPPPSPATSPPPSRVPAVPTTPVEQDDTAVSAPDRITECSGSHWSRVNAVVLVAKILTVLVLVASVERLTVGITASAFALLLLEYAGLRRAVVSCSVAESRWRWFQKVSRKERVVVERIEFEFAELNKGLSIDEIEVVETTNEGGICCSEIGDVALKVLEPCLCDEDVSECKIRPSRSGRFRSKMVKLVSKKFRGSKKKNKHNEGESGSEISSAVGEEKLPILEIEEEEEEENGDNKSSNTKPDCGITCSYEKKVNRVENSGSSMVLVMIIALVGLLLGRFPALVLLMTWCCLMKILGILWRTQKVPMNMIKCSVSNS